MNTQNIENQILDIEKNIESLKSEIEKFRCETKKEDNDCIDNIKKMEVARKLKTIYSLFARGFNSWEVAEYMQEYFPSVYDAYYFVLNNKRQEVARQRYAKAYLVKCLSENGFKKSEISKIAKITPQRCSQIVKNSVF